MVKVEFHARFENGFEFSDVYVNGEKRFICVKIDCLNPYWKIKSLDHRKLGEAKTLLIVRDSIESGEMEKRLASYSK